MTEIILSGAEGRLEAKLHKADNSDAPVALVLHPHPLYGGTMNNKVVYNIYHSFVDAGFTVLRFNFRGVGKSSGKFDNGVGELIDAATVLDWLQTTFADAKSYWVSGFSFGSWIAMQLLMRRPELKQFVAVSPPVAQYDFSFLSPCPTSGLIIQGDKDSVVSVDEVSNFVDRISTQRNITIDYNIIANADHFFRNNLPDLREITTSYLKIHRDEAGPKIDFNIDISKLLGEMDEDL